MPGFYDMLKGEPEDGYGIPIDAYIKYQRDHIDRVESTTEDHMDTVIITRTSPISGTINEMTLNISPETFDRAYDRWESGTYIQDAFHMLNAHEREFIKTGITPAEWDNLFGTDTEE